MLSINFDPAVCILQRLLENKFRVYIKKMRSRVEATARSPVGPLFLLEYPLV